jgi:hypothetical protein
MASARERAEGYRKEAKTCLELAGRLSLDSDRARLTDMAMHWLRIAEIAEAKAPRGEDAE